MDARRLAAIVLLLTASFGIAANPVEALPGPPAPVPPLPPFPSCPLGPTTDPPVCVPPPPPLPDVCQEIYNVQQSIEPNPGLFGANCRPFVPECRDIVNETEPTDPCEPSTECQNYLGPLELEPDPCQEPQALCEEAASGTAAFKEEACTPPTCMGLASDLGMDSAVMEAACDTLKLPMCEETPDLVVVGGGPAIPEPPEGSTREADCLPCVGADAQVESCADLCLANELADCVMDPPGCENARSVMGGLGYLLLDDSCLPRIPLCNELGVSAPSPNVFPMDCVPFEVPPSCAEIANLVNDAGEDYLPTEAECGVPGILPSLPPIEIWIDGGNPILTGMGMPTTKGDTTVEVLPLTDTDQRFGARVDAVSISGDHVVGLRFGEINFGFSYSGGAGQHTVLDFTWSDGAALDYLTSGIAPCSGSGTATVVGTTSTVKSIRFSKGSHFEVMDPIYVSASVGDLKPTEGRPPLSFWVDTCGDAFQFELDPTPAWMESLFFKYKNWRGGFSELSDSIFISKLVPEGYSEGFMLETPGKTGLGSASGWVEGSVQKIGYDFDIRVEFTQVLAAKIARDAVSNPGPALLLDLAMTPEGSFHSEVWDLDWDITAEMEDGLLNFHNEGEGPAGQPSLTPGFCSMVYAEQVRECHRYVDFGSPCWDEIPIVIPCRPL